MRTLNDYTTDELRSMAQGCTEFACIYHGPLNQELRRRERLEREAS